MAEIDVQVIGTEPSGWRFRVTVREGDSSTEHELTLSAADHERLGEGRRSPEELVRAGFAFLLEREPKESILPRFDLAVIESYFPGFEDVIRGR